MKLLLEPRAVIPALSTIMSAFTAAARGVKKEFA
jgi:hypothetical protein